MLSPAGISFCKGLQIQQIVLGILFFFGLLFSTSTLATNSLPVTTVIQNPEDKGPLLPTHKGNLWKKFTH